MAVTLAASLAGVLVWLLVPGPGHRQLGRLDVVPGAKSLPRSWAWGAGITVFLFALIAIIGGPRATVWALALAVTGVTLAGLLRRDLGARRQRAAAREVARASRMFASQLRIGQVPVVALAEVAAECSVLRPAAETARIGGDVAGALRRLADQPGRLGLTQLAAAWQLSGDSGAPIADAADRVAEGLREEEATAASVAVEVAGARTTGRIMALLPLAGLGLGYLAGGDPVRYIATTWLGQTLFVAGVALAAAGAWWLEWLADSVMLRRGGGS